VRRAALDRIEEVLPRIAICALHGWPFVNQNGDIGSTSEAGLYRSAPHSRSRATSSLP
jgi:hypothetical protein